MVPGIPGYVPMRERQTVGWLRSDGGDRPDIWDIEGKRGFASNEKSPEAWGSQAGSKGRNNGNREVYLLDDGEELVSWTPSLPLPSTAPRLLAGQN
jgi:hypothetical protein